MPEVADDLDVADDRDVADGRDIPDDPADGSLPIPPLAAPRVTTVGFVEATSPCPWRGPFQAISPCRPPAGRGGLAL
jgi:hypothetical protein